MTKKLKKPLILVVILLLAITVFPTQVSAKADNSSIFTPRLTAPTRSNDYYYSLNYYYKSGYGMPNCVAYAYGRIYEINKKAPLIDHGNASEWWSINKRNGYYEYGKKPEVGAIACWSGGRGGHVAVVEEVNGNTITISESHYGGAYFDTIKINSNGSGYIRSMKFMGYIYASREVAEELEYEKEEKEKQKIRDSLRKYKTEETDIIVGTEQSVFDMIEKQDEIADKVIVSERNLLA